MKITFRELFKRLDCGEKLNGELFLNGEKLAIKYYGRRDWRIFTKNGDLCMNMSSESLDTELDFKEILGLSFARYYHNGELPLLVLDSIAEAGCATGFGGTTMSVAPLYIKQEDSNETKSESKD